jgi:ribosomal protein S12 methylthiotransferase
VWFRLMYAFPRFLNDEMLDVLASDPRFCPYIDMPLQHIADRMLIDMGRGLGRRDTVALLDRIAAKLPGGAIRTTFIVGYPGETDAQFEELRGVRARGPLLARGRVHVFARAAHALRQAGGQSRWP